MCATAFVSYLDGATMTEAVPAVGQWLTLIGFFCGLGLAALLLGHR